VRQRIGLFLAPVSVVRQRQGRPARIGGGDREANSHGRGIDEECFINKMFCLHGSELFIGFFMNKIFFTKYLENTCVSHVHFTIYTNTKIKGGEKGKRGEIWPFFQA
jgi:hypothetical protein